MLPIPARSTGTSTRPSAVLGSVRKCAMMRSERRGSPTTESVCVSTPIFFDISVDRFSRSRNACGLVHDSSSLCGDAQYARGLKRTNIHRRMLKRRRHGLGGRLARAELRHRAILPTLRHACLHDARNNHWVKIHAIAGTTQQLAFRQLHNARIDFAQQIAQVLHGNALEHGRRMQRANKILRKLHATHQLLATLVARQTAPA